MNQARPTAHLVRHADSAWTPTGRHIGSTDLSLIEQGEYQAHALGASLTAPSIDRMLSSPPQRARRAAELAMSHARVVIHAWNGRAAAAASAP